MQTIHCKVSLDDQYRRFLFSYVPSTTTPPGVGAPESTFGKLRTLLSSLYGLTDEFTLKYKDDEDDLIIIGCDEEFNCAVGQSAGMLRLYIQVKKDVPMPDPPTVDSTSTSTSTSTASDTSVCPFPAGCGHSARGRHGHGHGRGGRGFGRGCHGYGHGQGHGHWHGHGHSHGHGHHGKHHRYGSKNKMEKLISKREYISAALNDPSVPLEEWQKHKFQRKLECIDRRLALIKDQPSADPSPLSDAAARTDGYTSTSSSSTSGDEKWRKKKCDKYRQKHASGGHPKQRHQRRVMTEDDKVAFRELKNQIWELRPLVNTIKIQMREKKAAKAQASDRGDVERARELEREIEQLKEIKREHKKAIGPLKEQIFALKFEQR